MPSAIAPASGDRGAEVAFTANNEPGDLPGAAVVQFDRILSTSEMAQRLGMTKPTLLKQMRAVIWWGGWIRVNEAAFQPTSWIVSGL